MRVLSLPGPSATQLPRPSGHFLVICSEPRIYPLPRWQNVPELPPTLSPTQFSLGDKPLPPEKKPSAWQQRTVVKKNTQVSEPLESNETEHFPPGLYYKGAP